MMRKIFFCTEFPVTPEKWWRKNGRQLRSFLAFKQTQKLELFKKNKQNLGKNLPFLKWKLIYAIYEK